MEKDKSIATTNVYFLHNHYLPTRLKNSGSVRSVIVPEFYSDLNIKYIGDSCYFSSISDYIEYVIAHDYYQSDTVFSIENPAMFSAVNIKKQIALAYSSRVRMCQIYCGKDNIFYTVGSGLSKTGKKYLSVLSGHGIVLDLSHVPNRHIKEIINNCGSLLTVSHCACTSKYSDKTERSNSINDESIEYLARRSALFGISFLNDIASATNNSIHKSQLLDDIIEQILFLVDKVGSERVGLGPDFIDLEYFSKRFGVSLYFPEEAYSIKGLAKIAEQLGAFLSATEIENIFWRNAENLLR